MDSNHDKVIQSHQWNIANHVATSNAGVVGGTGAANGGCCHANFHLGPRSTITSGSGGTPLCGFICTVESGKTGDSAVERLLGKTWVGLAGVDQPHPLVVRSRVSRRHLGPKTLACGHAAP